jgi:exoribonuclease R
MRDVVVIQGRFFRLATQSTTHFDKSSLRTILPEDIVDYCYHEGKVNVMKIISRKRTITYGILYGKTLSLPLLSPHFLAMISKHSYAIHPTSCLVKITTEEISIIKTYGPVSQRTWDLQICQDVYVQSTSNDFMSARMEDPDEPLYDFQNRVDQRELFTFNIDPAHSRDFDDAISVDIENRKIYVHIVDIHHQLLDEHDIETNARSLGNTLYLSEGVCNILPEIYSNQLLSLIEGEDRMVITVEMHLDENHNVINSLVYPAWIQIKKRYCYEEVDQLLDSQSSPVLEYLKTILSNQDCWRRTTIDVPQIKLIIQESKIDSIMNTPRKISHSIVEALMIKTNQIVSERIQQSDFHKILERYHETSDVDLSISHGGISEAMILLTRLRRAKYSHMDSGHFALQLKSYTHFTSPIRRSFDVLVHKVLAGVRFQEEWLGNIIYYLNDREILIDKICQLYQQWKFTTYIEDRGRVVYHAEILKVLPHGIQFIISSMMMTGFILLDDTTTLSPKDIIKVSPQKIDWKRISLEWVIVS